MSHSSTDTDTGLIEPVQGLTIADLDGTTGVDLLHRAKAIIAGRLVVPPIPQPAYVTAFFEREFAACDPPPTEEAIRFLSERPNLGPIMAGEALLCFRQADQSLAILARGEEAILRLIAGLTPAERAEIVIETPDLD